MSAAKIENLLRETIGLDAATIGQNAVNHAVRARMAQRRVHGPAEYWEIVRSSPDEVQTLVEEVVVPETWFFRDRDAFAVLCEFATGEWLPKNPVGALRLLSFPCSTGEEPYSMAMTLLDAGVPPNRFSVDAVDISERALEKAKRAVYGRNSFRGKDLDFRALHFHKSADDHKLAAAVRKQVHFFRANLLNPQLKLRSDFYDVIFCRNALIYFDTASQEQAFRVLDRLLAPDGVLIVGPAEAFLAKTHGFHSAGYRLAAAFRNTPSNGKPVRAPSPAIKKPPIARAHPRPAAKKPINVQPAANPALPDLQTAAHLADSGRLREAAEICTAHLRAHGPSPAAHYLSGLICDASGDASRAAEHYRKAIYLAPNHADALLHLALLTEKQGDLAAARRLRDRARRAEHAAAP